jgi:hypothetical protein
MSAASDGQDEYDLPELQPFAPPYLTVVFPHPEWSGDWWSHTADFRQSRPGAGGTWDFEVRSDTSREITLNWSVFGDETEILERSILIDRENGDQIMPMDWGSYTTLMIGPIHRFTWRINSLPQVRAGRDRRRGTGRPLTLWSRFHDEDAGDTHSATIDWGDGTVSEGVIRRRFVRGRHTYNEVGDYVVEVCVEDDHGGRGCDELIVRVKGP